MKRWNADVILVEFPLSDADRGTQNVESVVKGMNLLLQKLRARYPNAIVIYVHHYSLTTSIVHRGDGRTPMERESHDHLEEYVWGGETDRMNQQLLADMGRIVQSVGGYVHALPRTSDVADSVYFFDDSWDHLTQEGHNEIAEGVMKILISASESHKRSWTLGRWDKSIKCD
eukprot:CAMPEP_0172505096 /NCGR_PEP_ID=MMETSP1066-20121228/183653_1 /TAXON_ID=671091 /ORGANISM="Coscinodiscus wailesii, Strain CCMP2513" /LENGTH=171 /DNA_ID=CAMNT_0013281571 /DNA_START=327 /DNA_END=839 /DNA_ORIENTATION=+